MHWLLMLSTLQVASGQTSAVNLNVNCFVWRVSRGLRLHLWHKDINAGILKSKEYKLRSFANYVAHEVAICWFKYMGHACQAYSIPFPVLLLRCDARGPQANTLTRHGSHILSSTQIAKIHFGKIHSKK